MADVVIATPNGHMPAYVAIPAGSGPWPGVVVIHDFTGMSHDLRNQADWLAGEGFLAAAPDLYYWGSRLRCLWTIMREVTAGKAAPSPTSTRPASGCQPARTAPGGSG
jgi:carboxymethylenebutenolidase